MINLKYKNNIYFATIENSSFSNQWRNELEHFPNEIIKHCLKFHQIIDQKRRFLGYWLLKQHLIDNGLNLNNLNQIVKDKQHKPSFSNSPNIHFNLSYSGDFAVCAFSNNNIGIDIEKINQQINLDNYKSVFSQDTWSDIVSSHNPIVSFYNYWTKMEAVIKADGHGITGPIHEIIFEKFKITFNHIEREFTFLPINENYISHVVGSDLNNLNLQQIFFN